MHQRWRVLASAMAVCALGLQVALPAAPIIGALRVILLLDSSSAISPMINPLRTGLLAFIDNLPGSDDDLDLELGIVSTGGQLRVRVPPTTERARLRAAVAGFAADGGGNAFVDTLLEADKRFLRNLDQRRPVFVVVMTDNSAFRGEPRVDEYNAFARDFVRRGGRAHGLVVGLMNAGVHTDILSNLAENTGGYFDSLAVGNALPDKLKYAAAMVSADVP